MPIALGTDAGVDPTRIKRSRVCVLMSLMGRDEQHGRDRRRRHGPGARLLGLGQTPRLPHTGQVGRHRRRLRRSAKGHREPCRKLRS